MACYIHKDKDGRTFHICGKLGKHCADCRDVATKLCDYPVGDGKTCDRGTCENHSHNIAPDIDYCDSHFKIWEEFRKAGGVKKCLENVVPYKTNQN